MGNSLRLLLLLLSCFSCVWLCATPLSLGMGLLDPVQLVCVGQLPTEQQAILGPYWHSGEESACQYRRHSLVFNPGVRRIPWSSKLQSSPLLLLGKSHGQRSLVSYNPWGCKVGHNTTRSTHTHTHTRWCPRIQLSSDAIYPGIAQIPQASHSVLSDSTLPVSETSPKSGLSPVLLTNWL